MPYTMLVMVAAEGGEGWRWGKKEESDGGTRDEEGPGVRGQKIKRVPRGKYTSPIGPKNPKKSNIFNQDETSLLSLPWSSLEITTFKILEKT